MKKDKKTNFEYKKDKDNVESNKERLIDELEERSDLLRVSLEKLDNYSYK